MAGPHRWNPQQRPPFSGRVFRYVPHFATVKDVARAATDGTFAQRDGGRWNPPGSYPVLYSSCSRDVAIANLQHKYQGRSFQPWELAEDDQEDLHELEIDQDGLIDVVTDAGVAGVGLPTKYPSGVGHATTQPIGLRLYREHRPGIWCRSAAFPTGQEVALFSDYAAPPLPVGIPQRLRDWFPVPPEETDISE